MSPGDNSEERLGSCSSVDIWPITVAEDKARVAGATSDKSGDSILPVPVGWIGSSLLKRRDGSGEAGPLENAGEQHESASEDDQ